MPRADTGFGDRFTALLLRSPLGDLYDPKSTKILVFENEDPGLRKLSASSKRRTIEVLGLMRNSKRATLGDRFWREQVRQFTCYATERLQQTKGLFKPAILGTIVFGVSLCSIGVSQSPPGSGVSANPLVDPMVAIEPNSVPKFSAAGDMIGFSHSDGSGTQTITIVHTSKSWMAVYHIDKSGAIRLVSSRPIDADFSLQLNATSPLPEEIRQLNRR